MTAIMLDTLNLPLKVTIHIFMHYLSNVLTIPNGYLIVSLKIFKTLDLSFLVIVEIQNETLYTFVNIMNDKSDFSWVL